MNDNAQRIKLRRIRHAGVLTGAFFTGVLLTACIDPAAPREATRAARARTASEAPQAPVKLFPAPLGAREVSRYSVKGQRLPNGGCRFSGSSRAVSGAPSSEWTVEVDASSCVAVHARGHLSPATADPRDSSSVGARLQPIPMLAEWVSTTMSSETPETIDRFAQHIMIANNYNDAPPWFITESRLNTFYRSNPACLASVTSQHIWFWNYRNGWDLWDNPEHYHAYSSANCMQLSVFGKVSAQRPGGSVPYMCTATWQNVRLEHYITVYNDAVPLFNWHYEYNAGLCEFQIVTSQAFS